VLGTLGGIIVTHAVEIPALDGRSPLGFLAALGLLNLLNDCTEGPVGMSFTPSRGTAVIHSPMASLGNIEEKLKAVVAAAANDTAITGLDPGFPLPPGRGKDPMRHPRDSYRQFAADIRRIDPHAADHWLPHLLTDLAVDREGRAALTPFSAPRSKQNVRSFFGKSLSKVHAEPSRIREALAAWRRIEGVTGEYLDHHVLNSPADNTEGQKEAERGVPGATWLATMALPLLRLTGDGQNVAATLWHRTGRRFVMIWPLWRQALDTPAVRALIEHPCLIPVNSAPAVSSTDWDTLGIFGVYGADRQKLPDSSKFAGVLAPIPVTAIR
jgi:hypothetical protein